MRKVNKIHIKRYIVATAMLLATFLTIEAQKIYTIRDSIIINEIIKSANNNKQENRILFIASQFMGAPYVASTLELFANKEPLVIDTQRLDCTTFVEVVTAIAITYDNFTGFCNNLERIRYRNGVRNGYESRLHYISQWVCDSAKENILEEVITREHTAIQKLRLDYMSTHPENYLQLKENPELTQKIAYYEKPFHNIEVKYIPKEKLNKRRSELDINNGDIIAIVTSINGLDVTHIGFAKWIGNNLHMLHASSNKGKVILDDQTLYDYMSNKKRNLGIRVIRFKNL